MLTVGPCAVEHHVRGLFALASSAVAKQQAEAVLPAPTVSWILVFEKAAPAHIEHLSIRPNRCPELIALRERIKVCLDVLATRQIIGFAWKIVFEFRRPQDSPAERSAVKPKPAEHPHVSPTEQVLTD